MNNILSKEEYFNSDQFIFDAIEWAWECVCGDELEDIEALAGNVDPFTCLKRFINETFDGGVNEFYEMYVDFNK